MTPCERMRRGALIVKAAMLAGLLLGAALGITLSSFLTRTPKET